MIGIVSILEFIGLVITIITFSLFLIGRIFVVWAAKDEQDEKFFLKYKNDDRDFQEEIIISEEENSEFIYLEANSVIRKIKVYELQHDVGGKKKKLVGKEIKRLRNGETLMIQVRLSEGIPNYMISYRRADFIKSELILMQSGKNGKLLHPELKRTFFSILYYFSKI